MEKLCSNCKFGKGFKYTNHPKPRLKSDFGQCAWDGNPKLPLSVTLTFGWHGLHKGHVSPTWPGCPTWEAKEEPKPCRSSLAIGVECTLEEGHEGMHKTDSGDLFIHANEVEGVEG